jgi:hypothetical protein
LVSLPKRVLPVALVVAALAAALTLPSAASATPRHTSVQAALTRTDRSQNSLIKRTRRSLAAVNTALQNLISSNKAGDKSLSDRIGNIEAGVPAIVSALTGLKDAATALGSGLTTVGSSLSTLATAYQSVEYGTIGVFDGTTQVGGTLVSSDIPDDGNPAMANGSFPFIVADASSHTLIARARIRSNEADVNDPHTGQVGGVLYVKCMTPNPAPGGFTADHCGATPTGGDMICSAGPTPNETYTFPDGTSKSLPLEQVGGTSRTDTNHPNSSDLNLVAGATPDTCTIPASSPGIYEVTVSAQFTDFPLSLTPGPAD